MKYMIMMMKVIGCMVDDDENENGDDLCIEYKAALCII